MAWPPSTHGDVEDALTAARGQVQFPADVYVTAPGTATSVLSGVVGTAYAMPIFLPAGTVSEIVVRVTTASTSGSGGTVQLGLYGSAASVNGTYGRVPGGLLVTGTAISTETTGNKVLSVSQSVTGGLYWVGVLPLVLTAAFASVDATTQTGRVGSASTFTLNLATVQQTGQSALPDPLVPNTAGNGLRGWVRMSAVT